MKPLDREIQKKLDEVLADCPYLLDENPDDYSYKELDDMLTDIVNNKGKVELNQFIWFVIDSKKNWYIAYKAIEAMVEKYPDDNNEYWFGIYYENRNYKKAFELCEQFYKKEGVPESKMRRNLYTIRNILKKHPDLLEENSDYTLLFDENFDKLII